MKAPAIVQQIYENFFRLPTFKRNPKKPQFPIQGLINKAKKTELEQSLGIKIDHIGYFEQACTHRSYLQVQPEIAIIANERLEFLGDAILGMVIAEYLFYHYEQDHEGELTKMRSWLVNKKSLAHCARSLKLERFLLLSFSAEQSLQKGNETILADAMEAIIAAIYLDSGLQQARTFVIEKLIPMLTNEMIMKDSNFKSILLELVQSEGKEAPRYSVIESKGPDHEKEFLVAVYVNNEEMGRGSGKSKKQAEQEAAHHALESVLREHAIILETERK